MGKVQRFWREEKGQALSEYTLIISLVAAALVLSLILFKDKIKPLYEKNHLSGT
ncbi:MAG: Flp family type IVb pilin [Bacillota bacterium]|uniref:Flp pilus assembly protein, pilin Flp n=2 Tax=Carboxydocella TaxID=178898 RepID=A0A1T4REV7_9FIRM|nr:MULTISPECIES: Flp family type IVb pilin [Carboxydocella]AVX21711.1 Flp pilus assembly protein, pilin Flp [Carboxydocella thermautotrophica]AVX32122.1 Flp pilus assembly protein, pilin Flp [Carboxydocella thermautotrophica]SKA14439.1 Flp pilus assembly protein, pilin Flp [Carboxydocella sporoproducens DSM 16521]GAW27642.1 hypothetical protein ULO1_02120 [Carboxydocella sp. ULO1]GAW31837.1 hypothetical protein JDF658_16020 [Carboxydocella sp. JDF658]